MNLPVTVAAASHSTTVSDESVRLPLPEPCELELLADARAICRGMLDVDPNDASVLHLLGQLAARARQDDLAISCFRRAIQLDVKNPDATCLGNLADALERRGFHAEAVSVRLRVLRQTPLDAEVYRLLGQALAGYGQHAGAVVAYRESMRLHPERLLTIGMVGDALDAVGNVPQALAQYEAYLRLRPNDAEMYGRVGRLRLRGREWMLARDAFSTGLRCVGLRDADRATLLLGLGQAQLGLGEHQDAEATFRAGLSRSPTNLEALSRLIFVLELLGRTADAAQVWLSLGVALEDRARVREAITAYQQALARQPDSLDVRIRLGSLHLLIGEVTHAVRQLESAVAIAPNHVLAHARLGEARHLSGERDKGWDEFAWLSHIDRVKTWRAFEQPMWDGCSLDGRTILLWATPDLGFGDTIQFVRYARLLKARGADRVNVQCQPSLVPLVARVRDVSRALARFAPLPSFDVHAPLMLVPVLDHAAREPAAADVPYLSADPRHVEVWRERLGAFAGLTIGLCWGAQSPPYPGLRSIPLHTFGPLARLRAVRFVSLQLGPRGDEAFVPPPGLRVKRMLSESASMAHTAALVHALDLVITVDTMIAHLTGALGQSVWTLLPYGANWRWGREETTPWYPTMRLFRQRSMDDWKEVVERVCESLHQWVVARGLKT